jgi:hypothetical protein
VSSTWSVVHACVGEPRLPARDTVEQRTVTRPPGS